MTDDRNNPFPSEFDQYHHATHLYGYPLHNQAEQGGSANPSPAGNTTPTPEKKRHVPRMIASIVALSLLSGVAGGAATYGLMRSQEPAAVVQSQKTNSVQEAPASAMAPVTLPGTTPSGGADIASIAQKTSASVVEITTTTVGQSIFLGRYEADGAGSGVILSQDGYIVTNNHVVENADTILVRSSDGTEYTAKLVGTDPKTDLAVVKVDAQGMVPATFGNSESLVVGEPVVAIGNSLGTLGGTVTNGIISAKDREITLGTQTMHLLQTSAAINPGNSGGGLFNAEGHLIGIVNAKSAGSNIEGLGFAIPANTVQQVAEQLMDNGYVSGRPQLGIRVMEVSDSMTMARYRVPAGIYVAEVIADIDLQEGDRILSVDSKVITASSDITGILDQHKVGDVLSLTVDRDGQEVQVKVPLSEQVPDIPETQPKQSA